MVQPEWIWIGWAALGSVALGLAVSRIRVGSALAVARTELESHITALDQSTARTAELQAELGEAQQLTEQQRQELQRLFSDRAALNARLERLPELEARLRDQTDQSAQERNRANELAAELASMRTALHEQQQNHQEKVAWLEEARKTLNEQFENLANRIFQQKSAHLTQSNQQQLELTLNPLREQLREFRKRVDDVYDRESRDRASLRKELFQLMELNQQLSSEADSLTKALKGDNKAQGNWGEVILERVLEESGLHKGREYETQVALKSADGSRRNPDVLVHLPDNKQIIIDSKVSLVDYERYCRAESEEERARALQRHIASIRAHIDGLSLKAYEQLEGVRSLDFVFIFIPIEAAFMAAFESDQSVFQQAYDKNVIVVGPTTLLATLRTVQSIWRYERQNRHAEAIARKAGALHDKFVGVIESLEALGGRLRQSQEAYDTVFARLSKGRGNLVSQVVGLEKLGAQAKKSLPSALVEDALEEDGEQSEWLASEQRDLNGDE